MGKHKLLDLNEEQLKKHADKVHRIIEQLHDTVGEVEGRVVVFVETPAMLDGEKEKGAHAQYVLCGGGGENIASMLARFIEETPDLGDLLRHALTPYMINILKEVTHEGTGKVNITGKGGDA